jgi:hypothetical protein
MESNKFWKEQLLRTMANECIWHVIIPTNVAVTTGTRETLEKLININNPGDIYVLEDKLKCSLCKNSIQAQRVTFAIRFLVTKRFVPSSLEHSQDHYLYHTARTSASICEQCRNSAHSTIIKYNQMFDIILESISVTAQRVAEMNIHNDLKGLEFWKLIRSQCMPHILTKLGKLESECQYCSSSSPISRCSGCNYIRYCDEKCSHADWSKHKPACKAYRNFSLFCDDSLIKVLHT